MALAEISSSSPTSAEKNVSSILSYVSGSWGEEREGEREKEKESICEICVLVWIASVHVQSTRMCDLPIATFL